MKNIELIIASVIIFVGLFAVALGIHRGITGGAVRYACIAQHITATDCADWSRDYTDLAN